VLCVLHAGCAGGTHVNLGRPSKYLGPPTPSVTWPEFVGQKLQEKPDLKDKFSMCGET
jgi:hypothetical protein